MKNEIWKSSGVTGKPIPTHQTVPTLKTLMPQHLKTIVLLQKNAP